MPLSKPSITATMRAAQIEEYGDGNNIILKNVTVPTLSDSQVLVKVSAAGLNPFDLTVMRGEAHSMGELNFPATVGQDFAGTVIKIGNNVHNFSIGDRVCGTANALFGGTGACAEYVVTEASKIALLAHTIDDIHAAGLPTAGSTALEAINNLHVSEKDNVFIHGGAGGVGTFAIQIAKAKGAYVSTTASAENHDFVMSLGADEVIDYKKENYVQELRGYDALLNATKENPSELLSILKSGGRAVSLTVPFDEHISSRRDIAMIVQSTKITHTLLAGIVSLVDKGLVIPQIDSVYKFEDISSAFRDLVHKSIRGKIVIKI